MAPTVSPVTARARAAIEQAAIHRASCRARRQGLACSTCSDLAEAADRAIGLLVAPSDQLVIRDGVVHWSRVAA